MENSSATGQCPKQCWQKRKYYWYFKCISYSFAWKFFFMHKGLRNPMLLVFAVIVIRGHLKYLESVRIVYLHSIPLIDKNFGIETAKYFSTFLLIIYWNVFKVLSTENIVHDCPLNGLYHSINVNLYKSMNKDIPDIPRLFEINSILHRL